MEDPARSEAGAGRLQPRVAIQIQPTDARPGTPDSRSGVHGAQQRRHHAAGARSHERRDAREHCCTAERSACSGSCPRPRRISSTAASADSGRGHGVLRHRYLASQTPVPVAGRRGHLRSLAPGGRLGPARNWSGRTALSRRWARWRRSAKLQKTELLLRNQKKPIEGLAMAPDSRAVYDIAGKGFTRFRGDSGRRHALLRSDVLGQGALLCLRRGAGYAATGACHRRSAGAVRPWRDTPEQFATRLFQYALLRDPLPQEREIAGKLLGGKGGRLSSDGLEDLLWSIFLLPEFQYVR